MNGLALVELKVGYLMFKLIFLVNQITDQEIRLIASPWIGAEKGNFGFS